MLWGKDLSMERSLGFSSVSKDVQVLATLPLLFPCFHQIILDHNLGL